MTVAARGQRTRCRSREKFSHICHIKLRAPPILEPAEHDLNAISQLVILERRLASPVTGDAGVYSLVLQRLPQPVSVIISIAQQAFHVW